MLWNQTATAQILEPVFTSCVNLGKSINLSGLHFLFGKMQDNNITHYLCVLGSIDELIHVQHLEDKHNTHQLANCQKGFTGRMSSILR